jgi:light-regulated signal transduction histidine kinase (bacteriophytochrome)
VVFDLAAGVEAEADPALAQVVLENLLGNAWKYTGQAEEARIAFGAAEVEGGRAFFVRDNGVGFDPARVADLFAPFKRLHAGEQFEGFGIGLATVQRIVARHGGRIWAEGAPGLGATFYFTL